MNINEIKEIIKEKLLIERLELEDITAEEIEDDMPLFGDGLGLDSIEALDLVAGLQEEFKINLEEMPHAEMQEHFYSVQKIAEFIQSSMAESLTV